MADGKRAVRDRTRRAYAAQIGVTEPNVRYPVRCAYCDALGGVNIDRRPGQRYGWVQVIDLEWDHIWPDHLGGTDELNNVTLACRSCNRSKGHKTMAQWLCART